MRKGKILGIIVLMVTMVAVSAFAQKADDVVKKAQDLQWWANGQLRQARNSSNYDTVNSIREAIIREMRDLERLYDRSVANGTEYTSSQSTKYHNAWMEMGNYVDELKEKLRKLSR